MPIALQCFFASYLATILAVFTARAIQLLLLRSALASASRQPARESFVGAVPVGVDPKPVGACCMDALPDGLSDQPLGYSWVCGVCGQWWKKTKGGADAAPPPESDCG